MEDYAWIVEYLPSGHATQLKREPVVQLVGEKFFTLLEATVKPTVNLVIGQRLYVGKEQRGEVQVIKGRIKYEALTSSGRESLTSVLRKIIESREKDFVEFLNKCRPISIRFHTLDLLPGIGKKNMEAILKEREKQPFESFADLKNRLPTVPDLTGIFVHRIINEVQANEKYYLFVKPPLTPGFR